jgi:hypothetical protein
MPQTSWGQAQAVPNHSRYRLPANTTLRKIKARTKADRHPGTEILHRGCMDERDRLLNDSNQKYLPRRLSFAGNLLHRIASAPRQPVPGIVGKNQIAAAGRPAPSAAPRGLLVLCACAPASVPASSVRTA